MLMIPLFILSAIRHLICGNNWSWLLNLNLIYETLWTGAGSGLLISMLKKNQQVSFDLSNNTVAIDVKMDGSVLAEKSSFKMLRLTFFSFFSLFYEVSFSWGCPVSINVPYAPARNTVVTSGLVPLVVTCNCSINYKNV